MLRLEIASDTQTGLSGDPPVAVLAKYFNWLDKLLAGILGGETKAYFVVRNISHSSPVAVELGVREKVEHKDEPDRDNDSLVLEVEKYWPVLTDNERFGDIHAGVLPSVPNFSKDGVIASIDGRPLEPPVVQKRSGEHDLDVEYPAMQCYSTYNGMLKRLNIHRSRGGPVFYIYPLVGPKKIECRFKLELLDDVKAGFGEKVSVSGRAFYKEGDRFPHRFDVDRFEQLSHKGDEDKPLTVDSLAAPSDDHRTPEEYVRALRNRWKSRRSRSW